MLSLAGFGSPLLDPASPLPDLATQTLDPAYPRHRIQTPTLELTKRSRGASLPNELTLEEEYAVPLHLPTLVESSVWEREERERGAQEKPSRREWRSGREDC